MKKLLPPFPAKIPEHSADANTAVGFASHVPTGRTGAFCWGAAVPWAARLPRKGELGCSDQGCWAPESSGAGCCGCWWLPWCSQLAWLQPQRPLSCGCRRELILSFVLASCNAKELINFSLKVLSSPETYRICFFIRILSPLKPLFPDSIHIFQQLIFSFA